MTQVFTEHVLLYDGLCNFCDGTVQFILSRDRAGTMKFAPVQGKFARQLLDRHPELAHVDSLMLVQRTDSTSPEVVLVRSAAVVAIGNYLGGVWRVPSMIAHLLPRSARDAAYDMLARRRIRLFGRRDACRVPTAAERARFLD